MELHTMQRQVNTQRTLVDGLGHGFDSIRVLVLEIQVLVLKIRVLSVY